VGSFAHEFFGAAVPATDDLIQRCVDANIGQLEGSVSQKLCTYEGGSQAAPSSQGEEAADRSKDALSVVVPKEAGEENKSSLPVNEGTEKVESM
jgi:hypothetical protein